MTPTSPKIDQIIRSDRKTIALIVKTDGRLVVRAPLRATDEQIWRFVLQKAGWIREKQAIFAKQTNLAAPKAFNPGETFLYLGEAYPLDLVDGRRTRPPLQLNGKFQLHRAALPQARDLFIDWYREQARLVLTARTAEIAARTGLTGYKRIRITSARTRWGSCSSTGTLSFPWRLVMAPLPVIDYVVVHELVHLQEKNHAKRFWDKVAQIMPDYKKKVAWLKENGKRLML